MDSPAANGPVRLRDLGFGPSWVFGALGMAAGLPAAIAWTSGAPPWLALTCGGAAATALATAVAVGLRRLRGQLLTPLADITRAMESLRSSGQSQRLADRGASVLQPLVRRFNLAVLAVEQRDKLSKANLMSVEAAFDRVHAVLQSLRESVVVIDPQGRIVLLNRSARVLLGGETRVEGGELLPLLDGELRAAVAAGLQRIDEGQIDEVHATDLPQGERILDLTIAQVQSNRPDQDFGKVVVLADVTRNHELNRLKDELLSSISHELRTPLTNMCSSSEILTSLTAADEAEWREFATMLHTESHRLKSLVDDVMEYSQLETRQAKWNVDRADVAELVRSAVQMVAPKAQQKRIEIEVLSTGPALAPVDTARLTEALCRILDNAIKFTPEDGKVRVQTTVHDELVDVAIADSGPGIPPADRQRVFERFTQVGDVMTDKPQGAGLGLSITQRIVDAMGGTLWCEDSPLGGAQFRFVLPQTQSQPQA